MTSKFNIIYKYGGGYNFTESHIVDSTGHLIELYTNRTGAYNVVKNAGIDSGYIDTYFINGQLQPIDFDNDVFTMPDDIGCICAGTFKFVFGEYRDSGEYHIELVSIENATISMAEIDDVDVAAIEFVESSEWLIEHSWKLQEQDFYITLDIFWTNGKYEVSKLRYE